MSHLRQSTTRNRILRAMAPEDFARLQPHLDPLSLQLREVLIAPDGPVDELFFIESGMVSISTAHDERRIEVGLVGSEGLVGAVPVALDCHSTPQVYFVQLSGEGLSIGRDALCAAIGESPALRRRIEVLDRARLLASTNGRYGTPEGEYARLIEGA
ncbi:cyclic nucleotide-binding domain-containing protein [uncultured Methylobacterium sp.]|uniref:cyclic nucleotide-binding domain-containing protein n=1 Tax=uncultured Methylobacterium sp. TaxID=157278 RepID=UPI002585EC4A|nr:cyclic nucleotide-binding domain-containing protein [uncultured Methylobacterium sp.]